MGVLVVKCRQTGKMFSTGIQASAETFQDLPQVQTRSKCPTVVSTICGGRGMLSCLMPFRRRFLTMARFRSNDPIEPMTLGNMRANGVRSLEVSCWQCHQCHHRAIMSADRGPMTCRSRRSTRAWCARAAASSARGETAKPRPERRAAPRARNPGRQSAWVHGGDIARARGSSGVFTLHRIRQLPSEARGSLVVSGGRDSRGGRAVAPIPAFRRLPAAEMFSLHPSPQPLQCREASHCPSMPRATDILSLNG
jgi:hypothetical protein